jgi:hypothetical protein
MHGASAALHMHLAAPEARLLAVHLTALEARLGSEEARELEPHDDLHDDTLAGARLNQHSGEEALQSEQAHTNPCGQ